MKPLIPDTNANEERVVARKIAVVVGSIRKESINRKLAKALIRLAPKDLECELVRIDDLPVFNQDHDQNSSKHIHSFLFSDLRFNIQSRRASWAVLRYIEMLIAIPVPGYLRSYK